MIYRTIQSDEHGTRPKQTISIYINTYILTIHKKFKHISTAEFCTKLPVKPVYSRSPGDLSIVTSIEQTERTIKFSKLVTIYVRCLLISNYLN